MRVALVVDDFPSTSQTFIVDKVTGLLDRGVDVHVVCRRIDPAAWGRYPELSDRPGLPQRVHSWPGRNKQGAAVVATDLVRIARDPRLLARYLTSRGSTLQGFGFETRILAVRPDVVHFEFGWLAKAHVHLAETLPVPFTCSFRGADLNYLGLADDAYYDRVWARLAAIHCLGDDLWARAQLRGCPSDMPRALIPPAVNADVYRPPAERLRPCSDPFRVLTVARLHWKKGLEHGLEAVRRLRGGGMDVRYRIVGSGPHLPAVQACIADLGLGRSVELLGSRSRLEVREELATADVLLHPAISEGFGNAVLEAQAMQLPVVTTDADGLPANVDHGVTGYIVPRRDPGALAHALTTIATDSDLARRLGEAGRRRAIALFSPADQVDAFVALYRAVIDRAARSADSPISAGTAPPAGRSPAQANTTSD